LEARDTLLACSNQGCQPAVRADCVAWFEQVSDTIPSVLVSAKSGKKDEVNVHVMVDAKPFTSRLDGKPIELNPGLHIFRFEAPSVDPVEEQILLLPGEKNRLVSVTLGEPEPEPNKAPSPVVRERDVGPPGGAAPRPIPFLDYVFGGLTVVGAAGFAGLTVIGTNERRSLESSCRPVCRPSQVDEVHRKFVIADVSLGVAIVSAVAAGVVFLARPIEVRTSAARSAKADTSGLAPALTVDVSQKGMFIGVREDF
jgi:hypothetical protein